MLASNRSIAKNSNDGDFPYKSSTFGVGMNNIEPLKVEYLVVIKKKGAFCDKIETFLNFLKADSRFSINKTSKTIKYGEENDELLIINYEVQLGEVNEQRFFHTKLVCNVHGEDLEKKLILYQKFLRDFRSNVNRLDIELHVIWDDISLYYAKQAYPLIHEIENLMRKLIVKFMVTTLGIGWVNETSPKEIKEIIKRKGDRREGQTNFLYQIDFIDLAKFLLKPYPTTSDINELYLRLGTIGSTDELSLNYLSQFVPESNWQRYFSGIISYEGSCFEKRWEELYQLRNKIAHNNTFTRNDYEKVITIVNELGEKIREAVDKLDQIEISDEEREEVAENISININSLYGEFIQSWKIFEKEVSRILGISLNPVDKRRIPVNWKIDQLAKKEILDSNLYKQAKEINEVRNYLVHSTDHNFTSEQIRQFIVRLKTIIDELRQIQSRQNEGSKNIDQLSS